MKLSAAAKLSEMYPDRHLNIFVPYETHDLDYNVTRALICTLKWSRPELAQSFLKDVTAIEIGSETSVLYDLQACDYDDYDPEQCETRKILGISRSGEIAERLPSADELYQPNVLALLRGTHDREQKLQGLKTVVGRNDLTLDDLDVIEHTLEEYEQGSMPDGWIFTADGKSCVLIEAKLTRFLNLHQLDRHTETWFGEALRGDDQVLTSWESIAAFADKHSKDDCPRTAFLCRQLFEYLECLGHAPFESLKPFDLDGDALLDTLPKLQRLATKLIAAAQDAGLPIGLSVTERGTGLRLNFSDPSWVGVPGMELNDDQIAFTYTVGDEVEGRNLAGAEGSDKLLANTENGLMNPLKEWTPESSDLQVRVDRLVKNGARWTIDRTLFESEFVPADLGDSLDALVNQHPAPELRVAQGRSGMIVWSKVLKGEEALVPGDELLAEALKNFKDFATLARSLSAVPEATES